jgi:hypothetical protein
VTQIATETITLMKKIKLLLLPLMLCCSAIIAGCATHSPTATEQKLFDIQTNFVPKVTLQSQVVTTTNELGQTQQHTNVSAVTQQEVAGYTFTPKPEVKANLEATASGVGTIAGGAAGIPFLGSVSGMGVGLILTIWGWFRSSKRASAGAATAATLAQIIETTRELLKQIPDGAKYDTALVKFMQQHQTDAGTILQIANLLKSQVNNDQAQGAANQIIAAVKALQVPAK